MLRIQLRRKRTNLIPVRGVRNLDRSGSLNAPGLLVHLFDEHLLRTSHGLDLLQVTAEIADLVKRIPRGHSNGDFAGHVGNGHRHVEEVPFGMIQENRVLNCCSSRSAERQDK